MSLLKTAMTAASTTMRYRPRYRPAARRVSAFMSGSQFSGTVLYSILMPASRASLAFLSNSALM